MRARALVPLLLQGCFLFDPALWGLDEPVGLQDTGIQDTAWLDLFSQETPEPAQHQSQLWRYRSSTSVVPRGDVAPMARQDVAVVGLDSMLCEVDWSTGLIGLDSNADPDWAEEVTDFSDNAVLTITPRGWQLYHPRTDTSTWTGTLHEPAGARLAHEAVVTTLHTPDGCTVVWGGGGSVALPEACPKQEGWALDPDSLTAWVSTPTALVEARPDGTVQAWSTKGDLLAYDPERDLLFVASRGDSEVSAWQRDRTLRWRVDLGAPVRQLRAVPARGAVAALTDRPTGSAIVYLSVVDGASRDLVEVRAHIERFSLSVDGGRLAVIWGSQVDMFDEVAF